MSYAPSFAAYSVAHWGAIDGRNDWNDYDTVVIFGLSYRDQVWSTNTFFALQGLQDNRWLEQPSWGRYADVRQEMQRRQLTVSVIQAVNRVRCRRVIDGDGNCPPTDVFIVLPRGAEGDAILAHLQEEMPGAVIVPWEFEMDGPSERVRRGSSHEALLALMSEPATRRDADVAHQERAGSDGERRERPAHRAPRRQPRSHEVSSTPWGALPDDWHGSGSQVLPAEAVGPTATKNGGLDFFPLV